MTVEQLGGGAQPVDLGSNSSEPEVQYAVFDREQALAQFGDDPGFLSEIVKIFLDEVAGLVTDGDAALAGRNADSLAKIAHRLKGALGQMTAEQGQQAALAVELAAKAEEMDNIDELWATLVLAVDRLRPELAEFVPA